MWTLKLNPAKVQQYAQKFWEQTSYTFNKKTQYKMKVPKKYQGTRAFKYFIKSLLIYFFLHFYRQ